MNAQSILRAFRELSVEERQAVRTAIDDLMDSEIDEDDRELTEEQWEELRRRREAHRKDPSAVRPWEELCDRVRNAVRNAD